MHRHPAGISPGASGLRQRQQTLRRSYLLRFADNHIYSFSMIGQKVEWMRKNPQVCLQVDDFKQRREWSSVVVHGAYEELQDRIGSKREREHAWSLLSKHATWWEPGSLKPVPAAGTEHVFYRIRIETLTGRRAGVA